MHERRPGAPTAQSYEDATGCRAALLSAQARVAELESQVSPIFACWMRDYKLLSGRRRTISSPNSIRMIRERRNLPVQECLLPPGAAMGALSLGQHRDILCTSNRSACWSWSGHSTNCCWRAFSRGTRRTWIFSRAHTGTGLSPTLPLYHILAYSPFLLPWVGLQESFPNPSPGWVGTKPC